MLGVENEVVPIITKLYDENFDPGMKVSLKNYLIVSFVSTIEYFFKNEARRIVDQYDMALSYLFKVEISIPFSSLDKHRQVSSSIAYFSLQRSSSITR
jgi:hypothetical protein